MKKSGFSLMEMMIVLLITAVVAAATAPMVSRKIVSSTAAEGDSPWVWSGQNRAIAFNFKGNPQQVVNIGGIDTQTQPRLYIDTKDPSANPQLELGVSGNPLAEVVAQNGGGIGFGSSTNPSGTRSIAIGHNTSSTGEDALAVGSFAKIENSK